MGKVARRRLAFGLFLFVWFAYVATASGRLKASDIQTEFRVAASLVYHGTLESDRSGDTGVGIDGKSYTNHLVGESVLLIPAAFLDGGLLTTRAEIGIAMINPLFAAGTVVLLLLLLLDLGFGVRVALAASLCFAFATIAWAYAHDAFDVTPNGFFLLLCLLAARRRGVGGGARWLWISGLALALGLLVRYTAGLVILPVVAYLGWQRRGAGASAAIREVGLWLVPVALAAALLAWLNAVRFGSPTNIGLPRPTGTFIQPIGNQLLAMLGLVVSPGKGLLLFAPVLLLAILGLRPMLRRDAAFTWTLATTVLLTFAFYARLNSWSGDQAWGPRYVVPTVALLMVLTAPVLARWGTMGRTARAGVAALVGLGVVVNATVLLTGYERVMAAITPIPPPDHVSDPGYYFTLANSQLLWQFRSVWLMIAGPNPYGQYALSDGSHDYTWLYTLDFWWVEPWSTPGLRPFIVLVGVLLAALVLISGIRLRQAMARVAGDKI